VSPSRRVELRELVASRTSRARWGLVARSHGNGRKGGAVQEDRLEVGLDGADSTSPPWPGVDDHRYGARDDPAMARPQTPANQGPSFRRLHDALKRSLSLPRADGASGSSHRHIQCHGGANERLQRLFINLVALMEIDGTPGVAFEAGIEEP